MTKLSTKTALWMAEYNHRCCGPIGAFT